MEVELKAHPTPPQWKTNHDDIMSLNTDKIFIAALRSNSRLIAQLPAGDVYGTAITLPDEDLDNVPLPYIIVTYDGMNNDESTKDDYEGEVDTVQIGVLIVAKTRPEVGSLAQSVRDTIRDYFEDLPDSDENYDLVPYDYQFSADAVQYDSLKPSFWQQLRWSCDTNA